MSNRTTAAITSHTARQWPWLAMAVYPFLHRWGGLSLSGHSPEHSDLSPTGKTSNLGHAHRTMGVQDPLCNAAATETSGTWDHIPQGVPRVVVSEPVSARAAEQGSDRASSTHPRLLQPLVPCSQGNRGVEADHRSVLPQCLRALPELHYGDASVNPQGPTQGQWLTSLDLKDAYFHIGIDPADRRYLRFCHNGWARARILDTVANLATHFQKL